MNEGDPTSAQRPSGFRRWALLLLLCLLVLAVLGGLKYKQVREAIAFGESFPERSESVTAVVVEPVRSKQSYRTIGEVRATKYVELRNEVDGKIVEIGFVGGSPVAQGQLLLLLDSTEERAQLQATRAQLKLAELQLRRVAELRRKNLASNTEYDSAEADKSVLEARVAELTATIDKKSLVAPFDAQTGLHTLQVGQYLAPNSVITDLTGGIGEVWIDFNLPQGKASLSIGDMVRITGRDLSDGALTARVVSADSRLDFQSRSRGFRASLSDPPEAIRPGSVVDVEVILGTLEGVSRLPVGAVRRNNFGAFVYVLNEAEAGATAPYRASRRQVALGPTEGEYIIVTGGLEPGELVAALGAFKLVDGLLAHVVERDVGTAAAVSQAGEPAPPKGPAE